MERMQKTMDRAQDTARSAVETGATESRAVAAELVERVGAGIRRQSQRAARATEQAGDRIGSQLERKAADIRPRRSPMSRISAYASRHPLEALLLFGLIIGVVALIAVPLMGQRAEEEAEFEGYTLPPRI